ncbi:hypothetical protein Dsin_006001 [Dipteronia sinensis]|uniref:Reverse transcriptase domain-containing protein n=1 Tax=Dipteronia sinensis TaxID=43782 RepID=A0AAE0AYV2_9ROSI|nr:hypothetical protein Dsin_006001 [Dipteronia sinensis]
MEIARFFHSKASARKARNRINGLFDERGVWRDQKGELETVATNYFRGLFCSTGPTIGDIGKIVDGVTPRMTSHISRFLDAKFTGEEVRTTVFAMNPIKAPGSDGLPAIFYQHYWQLVGSNIVEACLNILNEGATVEGLNNTVICLIPKNQNPKKMADFRPISLCNVIYKIIAKVITSRFRLALGDVISENQCAFVPGRLISDNTIVGFECLHRLKRRRRKKGSMAIKSDMSKAFDRVEWIFLESMIGKLGFSSKWVGLIMRYISSVTYSVLINGEVCGNIIPTRGLRQGDPLSFFIFLICAEGLTSLLHQAQIRGDISGFQCSRGGLVITHLFFADDSLIFTKANEKNCVSIKEILAVYWRASGQAINFAKSAMCISHSFSVLEGQALVSRVGIKLVECHKNYLGLPCFTGRSKRKIFASIVDRVWGKIKRWGEKNAFCGRKRDSSQNGDSGNLVLCHEHVPITSGLNQGNSQHLCKPKSEGGLGFQDLEISNRALLAKQCWRLLKNLDSLAGRVLKSCYYKEGSILDATLKANGSYVWNSLIWGKGLLEAGVRSRVGDGKSLYIYRDKWLPMPTTFKITSLPKMDVNATVDQLISPSGGWNTQLIRGNFNLEDTNLILQIPIVRGVREDNTLWHFNENGQYSVKSGYWLGHRLANMIEPSNISHRSSWWNTFWRKACQDWIPTKIIIGRRGVPTNEVCEACNCSAEDTLHTLWYCSKLNCIRAEWYDNMTMRGQHTNFHDLLYDCFSTGNVKKVDLFCIVVWRIWYCRNSTLHEAKKHNISEVVNWSTHFLQEFQSSRPQLQRDVNCSNRYTRRWIPPEPDAYKANCDDVLDHRMG